MKLAELEEAVLGHTGTFRCTQIRNEENTKTVAWRHVVTPPSCEADLPELGRLRDFYGTFGSLVLYHDPVSGGAARYIAPPSEWMRLDEDFSAWLDGVDEEELAETAPDWIGTRFVIGETPASGNYILMARSGSEAGHVFEFDHDGFEFTHVANDLVEYVFAWLAPNVRSLTDIASHMRFIEGENWSVQWWITELVDSRGNVVRTDV